jgi:alpha-tubulin suppressor-like RCC1 family protein
LAAGTDQTCELLGSGGVECWGANGYGQLGDATSSGPQTCNGQACATTPVTVHGITTATAVAAGNDHVCAVLAGGAVDCWGYNFAAELGVGTSSGPQWCAGGEWCATLPVGVSGIAGATQLAAGGDHTCAVVARGDLACWGYNTYGQLGDAISSGPQICYWQLVQCAKTPVAVHAIAGATAVVAGGDHTCALLRGGGVACWGDNWFGDLGNGSRSGPASCNGYPCSATPVSVSAPSSAAPGDRRARSAGAQTRTPATAGIGS